MFKKILPVIAFLCIGTATAETWDVATEPHYPPFNFEQNGVWTGVDTEIVERVLKEINVTPNYKLMPWKRVMKTVAEGDVNMGYQFIPKPERFEIYHLIGPIRYGQWVFAVRSDDNTTKYETINDLKGKVVGTVRGFGYPKPFVDANFETDMVAGNEKNIEKLAAGRVDIIITDKHSLYYSARLLNIQDKVKVLPKVIQETPRYIAFPKKETEKAKRFEAALNKLKASGEIQQIIDKWSQ